jgi:hypothetical protein
MDSSMLKAIQEVLKKQAEDRKHASSNRRGRRA